MMQRQPYHLPQASPWPITASITIASTLTSIVYWFNTSLLTLLPIPMITTLMILMCWWRDVTREASYCGLHTDVVQESLEWSMILFISSEVMFFFGFFWAFYHSSLSADSFMGSCWPPTGVKTLNPFSVPLLNTIVLLSSGATITAAHAALIGGDPDPYKKKEAQFFLSFTVLLGLYFTALQSNEYLSTMYTMYDSVFGSVFFMATGFHGLHVMVGATFLLITLMRMMMNQMSSTHHFGFEAAAWYWHFVDVVWLYLYLNLYWLSTP